MNRTNYLKYFTSLFFSLLFFSLFAQLETNLINKLNIKDELNYIQYFDSETVKRLANELTNTDKQLFSIVHFGDSHIQAEGPTSVTRKKMQEQYGDGGRGMMFAYSAANSYTSILYSTSHKGNWTFAKSFQLKPKIPIGVSGMTVKTVEKNASLTFNLKITSASNRKLRIYIDKDSTSFDFLLIANEDSTYLKVTDYMSSSLPYIEILVKEHQNKFSINTIQNNSKQNHFEFYGMSLETDKDKGIIYHSVGVGASQYGSVLVEELLGEQLPSLRPNLCILDFGTNNYLYDNIVRTDLGPQIEKIIRNLRSFSPNTLILLTSTQALFYKSKNVTSGIIFRDLIDSLAKKNNCLFWDWYAISGGKKSLEKWRDAGYAQKDLVHLTTKGYSLKGSLLFEAIQNTLDSLNKNTQMVKLVLPYTEIKENFQAVIADVIPKKENQQVLIKIEKKPIVPIKKEDAKTQTSKGQNYIVKKGDTLYKLASKFGTSIDKIKKNNNLKSDVLQIGQKLKIP